MKKIVVIALALAVVLGLSAALADPAVVRRTVYEGMGVVDVDFLWDVSYRDPQVTVTDSDGLRCAVRIMERDEDDLSFRLENAVPVIHYSYTISGVRSGFSGDYAEFTGSFVVPEKQGLEIKKVDYDLDDDELDVEFRGSVNLQDARISVSDAEGNSYDLTLRELEGDGFEAYVPGLQRGERYTVTVVLGGEDGGSTGAEFIAWDD